MTVDLKKEFARLKAEKDKERATSAILELAAEINFHEELLATIAFLFVRQYENIKEADLPDDVREAFERMKVMYDILKEKPAPDKEEDAA